MPIIAKLSKRFYERFGEDLANELVELLNQVDATSRADLRELNEANFRRLDSKIDAVAARLDANIDHLGQTMVNQFATKESIAKLESSIIKTLLVQTRWMQAAWITIMIAILAERFQR